MPLDATLFMPQGGIATAMSQLYSLLTGATKDQPVTLANVLSVGGWQGTPATALRVYGGIDLYATPSDATPGFSVGPGGFVWSGLVFAPSPAGGLRVGPRLEVIGDLSVSGTIQGNLPWDQFFSTYLRDLHPGTITMPNSLVIGNVDPWQAGLTSAQAELVVRAPDLPRAGSSSALSLLCWASNWLQFNVRFWDTDPAQGWPSKMLTLDFDADTLTPGTAGRIRMQNGKVGIGQVPDIEGAILAIQRRLGL
jgi:hypothetical protein